MKETEITDLDAILCAGGFSTHKIKEMKELERHIINDYDEVTLNNNQRYYYTQFVFARTLSETPNLFNEEKIQKYKKHLYNLREDEQELAESWGGDYESSKIY